MKDSERKEMFEIIEENLVNFEKPARYTGNEIGIPPKDFKDSDVRFLLCYPDVYEVGMSNYGLKILYDRLNKLDFVSCERVFSVWLDFEKFLREKQIKLFSLESKTPIDQFDFVGFSLQYELLFTNILNIMELGGIEVFREKRGENTPIIIAGGPCSVNPAPFAPFIDLFLIGEGEDVLENFVTQYSTYKKQKLSKDEIIKKLSQIEGIYSPKHSKNVVKRQIYKGFSTDKGPDTLLSPLIDIVQNKLVVEIMRGCPNKCRFCQAGYIYKPYREKNVDNILDTVEKGLCMLGINEVTLSSLSSGDYSNVLQLTDEFIKNYEDRYVSFSFPSLKVESFDSQLLDRLATVRKSGLTFAVEAGSIEGQMSINKPVLLTKVREIIEYASHNGWRLIKLYFMVGLPDIQNEKEQIISFIDSVLKINRQLNINVNIATFVPKSHTPYQYDTQISLEQSQEILGEIEARYKRTRVKIKKHNPLMSYIEGFISRGDESVGLAIYDVFKNGGRFDGWDDQFNYSLYRDAFEKNSITYEKYLQKKDFNEKLAWDNINVGISKEYLLKEKVNSQKQIITKSCKEDCEADCDICSGEIKKNDSQKVEVTKKNVIDIEYLSEKQTRYFIEFSKKGLAKFIGHIDLIKYFERLFNLSRLKIAFTEGFNPHAKMQFSSPLSLGVESSCEILEFFTKVEYDKELVMSTLKKYEHRDICINKIRILEKIGKISLINKINLTQYYAKFNKMYYNEVEEIFNQYKIKPVTYEIKGNNDVINGVYNDFVEFIELKPTYLVLNIKNMAKMPKILQIKKDIFKDVKIVFEKVKMFTIEDGKLIDLFEI